MISDKEREAIAAFDKKVLESLIEVVTKNPDLGSYLLNYLRNNLVIYAQTLCNSIYQAPWVAGFDKLLYDASRSKLYVNELSSILNDNEKNMLLILSILSQSWFNLDSTGEYIVSVSLSSWLSSFKDKESSSLIITVSK